MHAGSARDGDSSPLIGGARQQQHQHQHPLQQQAAMEEAMGSHLLPFSLQEEPDTKARRPRLFFMVWVLGVALAALLLSLVVVLAWLTTAEARTIQYVCPENITDGDRFVFVIGDWGRANEPQRVAAQMMAQLAGCMKPEFIISTGDNFYPHGVDSADDAQWQDSFLDVYNSESIKDLTWYAVLGNHDYGDSLDMRVCSSGFDGQTLSGCSPGCCNSPMWQVPSVAAEHGSAMPPNWRLQQGAWQQDFPDLGLQVTFIDTTPLAWRADGRTVPVIGGAAEQDVEAQTAELKRLLSNDAAVKIVVGHHPVETYGEHCQPVDGFVPSHCPAMKEWLQPLLADHGVLAYLCGHEHDLQYIHNDGDPVHYVVSGAGSDVRYHEFDGIDTHGALTVDDQGFSALRFGAGGAVTLYMWGSRSAEPLLATQLTA